MPVDLKKFNKDLRAATSKMIPEQVELVKKKVGMQLLERLVMMTPVDTGRARSNWFVTLDTPSSAVATNPPFPSASVTINDGANIISLVSGGQSIWISNNLPYIEPLENGWSSQAPAGMLAVALAEVGSQLT